MYFSTKSQNIKNFGENKETCIGLVNSIQRFDKIRQNHNKINFF